MTRSEGVPVTRPASAGSDDKFRDYVTSVAFHLSLSKRMVEGLLGFKDNGEADYCVQVPTYWSLEKRGLVAWNRDKEGKVTRGIYLTPAGRLVRQLVEMAFASKSKPIQKGRTA